ncbi:MAG: hypothetical protein ACREX4_19675 [Gammaproteobacteria bacterium]
MLVPGPIPLRQSPVALRAEDLRGLQENSRFLEMDLSPARILDIKDPWGNSVLLLVLVTILVCIHPTLTAVSAPYADLHRIAADSGFTHSIDQPRSPAKAGDPFR